MNLPPFCDIKKPHVYVSVVEIVIRNNDYSQFMIQTKPGWVVSRFKTGTIKEVLKQGV